MSRKRADGPRGPEQADTPDASRPPTPGSTSRLAQTLAARERDGAATTLSDVATAAVDGKDAGSPVPGSVRAKVEPHVGADLSGVRVHQDDSATQASAALGARAFAHGSDVFLGSGESAGDESLMAHELTHVVQQGAAKRKVAQGNIEVGPADSPAEREADAVASSVASGRPPALIVDDGAPQQPGQMTRSQFLSQLRSQVEAAANAELGPVWAALGCPYIEQVFSRYASADAATVERTVKKYAPETASATNAAGYFGPVVARVRRGVSAWKETGELPGDAAKIVPQGAAASPDEVASQADPQAQRTPSAKPTPIPGAGEPLDAGTARRMGDAMGEDFTGVRVHTGPEAARLADDHDARAFSVGSDIVFGAGELAPNTPEGDALLAHELAHTVQQRGASKPQAARAPAGPNSEAHEQDADRAAAGVMARLYGGAKNLAGNVGPALSTGFSMQRCPTSGKKKKKPPAKAPTRPDDQHEGLVAPDEDTRDEIYNALNPSAVSVAPPPPPVKGKAPKPPKPAKPKMWSGSLDGLDPAKDAAEIAKRKKIRAALKKAVTAEMAKHLKEATKSMKKEEKKPRIATAKLEGAANAAKGSVDAFFSGAVAAASATPKVAASRATLKYTASGGGQNLFDATNKADRAAAGRAIDPYDTADWIATSDDDCVAEFSKQSFNPTRKGTDEADFLWDDVVVPFTNANKADLERYDQYGFALASDKGIVLPTTLDTSMSMKAGKGGAPSDAERSTMWSAWHLAVHEYIHTLEHSNFNAAASGNRNFTEGFCELFTKEVITAELPTAHTNKSLITAVEGGIWDPPTSKAMVGGYSPGEYASYLAAAEGAKSALGSDGERAVRAAFFQGHVELLGLNDDGTKAPARTGPVSEVTIPSGISSLAKLAKASGVAAKEIKDANKGVDLTGALPAKMNLPGCRNHRVIAAKKSGEADTPESKAQIAKQNGVLESELERANPGQDWSKLKHGDILLIPAH
jgi:hypothetical protein